MTYFITHLKDRLGNNYLGIDIPKSHIEPFLNELKDMIGEDDFAFYTKLQSDRDGGHYHITVINVMEYNKLISEMGIDKFVNSLDPILTYEVDDIKMMGVGSASKNENRAYFVVCKSDKLEAIRERYSLPQQDFHITLGFKWKDVFGVRKNQVLEKESKFLQLLAAEYYKNDNWNFIKGIKNFNLNPASEIESVGVSEGRAKFSCDSHFIELGLLDDEGFWIMAQYPQEEKLPRISETELAKIFNKK